MNTEIDICGPASFVLGRDINNCEKCPFPFCVVAESNMMKHELRVYMARTLRQLGETARAISKTVGVSKRSIYRYAGSYPMSGCNQCDMVNSADVVCRSSIFSVIQQGANFITLLNKHGKALQSERNSIEFFIDYAFPESVIERSNGAHGQWILSRTSDQEAERFKGMCSALDKYKDEQIKTGVLR